MRFGSWRKLIQWPAGILGIAALAAAFLIGGLVRVASPPVAKPALAGLFKEGLARSEVAQNFDQAKGLLGTLPADERLKVPGFPQLEITVGEARRLTRDQLIARIARRAATKFYAGRLELPQSAEGAENPVWLLRAVFSADAHKSFSNLRTALFVMAAIMGALLFIFSYRFGRLGALGVFLLAAGALPFAAYTAAITRIDALKDGTAAADGMQLLAPLARSIEPALETARDDVLLAVIIGAGLLGAAVVGGLALPKR